MGKYNKRRTRYTTGARGASRLRRSVTILDRNHKTLQKARAEFMLKDMDMDYTTALNLLLEIGLNKYFTGTLDDADMKILAKYKDDIDTDIELKKAAIDEAEEIKERLNWRFLANELVNIKRIVTADAPKDEVEKTK